MVRLSDYLDYLYKEVIVARKKIDKHSVILAKEYAQDDYLKYFKVPRFTMPKITLDIPIKITDIVAENEYKLQFNQKAFISDVNNQIKLVNQKQNLSLKPINKRHIENPKFKNLVSKLTTDGDKLIINKNRLNPNLNFNFKRIGVADVEESVTIQANADIVNNIMLDALKKQMVPVSSDLKKIFIDPDTGHDKTNEKLLIQLHVELEEEGLRIVQLKQSDGRIIEEVIFE